MIKRGRRPGRRVVTDFALLREARRSVVRIGRSVEILQVATDACRHGKVVVAIQMALRARHAHVCPGQGEPGLRVIEGRG